MIDWSIVVFAIFIVLVYDFINGFHDAANSIATIISTQVLRPATAVLWAAFFTFVAMFFFPPKVASTISKILKIGMSDHFFFYVVLIGVASAIFWSILTWWYGLPISSSHALIGGLAGAGFAYSGSEAIEWSILLLTLSFIFIAPLLGFLLGTSSMLAVSWIFLHWKPAAVGRIFRRGQLVSAGLYCIGHGANDAQKMMGVIMALLLTSGYMSPDVPLSLWNPQTSWIIVACQSALGLGTMFGGWRIVKTMATKITKLKPVGGFCAETGGALTLFLASYFGIPVSTTHTIVGSLVGVGAMSHKWSNIRWHIAKNILWAWILTIPVTAAFAALLFKIASSSFFSSL